MQRERAAHVATTDEHVDFTIGVASDILDGRLDGRFFIQALDRHERENLVHAPAVGQALEQTEVAEVLLRKQAREFTEFVRRMAQILRKLVYLAHDAPEQAFAHGARRQVVIAHLETVQNVIVQLDGIVPAFEQVLRGKSLVDAVQILQCIGSVVVNLVSVLVEERLAGGFQHVEHQNGMVRRKSTARFRNDVRVRHVAVFAGFVHGVHHVVRVFLDGVVHRARVGTAGAVVIHTETAAHVHEFKAHAHLANLHVELRDFAQARFDVADVRNLATQVEVDELHAVFHLLLLDVVQRF